MSMMGRFRFAIGRRRVRKIKSLFSRGGYDELRAVDMRESSFRKRPYQRRGDRGGESGGMPF